MWLWGFKPTVRDGDMIYLFHCRLSESRFKPTVRDGDIQVGKQT